MVFLEASDEALVRRFEGVRRKHPLQGDGRITDGIDAERALLPDLRGDADLVIDTSALNVHELRAEVEEAFAGERQPGAAGHRALVRLQVRPAGRRRPRPRLRFLPNPHWVPELRPLTGLDPDVARLRASSRRGPPSCSTASATCCGLVAARLPPRGQALRDPRGRLHRRQAPQRRHGRGARSAAARRRRRGPGRPPRPGPRVAPGDAVPGPRAARPPTPARPRVVALGGGHGLAASLTALRHVTAELTAVVTVADDGGSSGRLRAGVRLPAARRPADGAGRALR